MPDVHARLSASGAKRWMKCTPSVALEEQYPDKEESVYAKEGTLAHALAELMLRYNNGEMNKRQFNSKLKKIQDDPLWSNEMQLFIEQYVNDVWEIANEAKASCKDPQILFEQRLDFSEWVEGGFGTGDVVIITDDTVHIIDLKFGKGVGVSAIDNPQLRLYGLGCINNYGILYDFSKVKMTIIQPRLDHTDSEELTVEELEEWARKEVIPRAELAYRGEGDFCAGGHCQFCKAKGNCRARAEENLKLAAYDFKEPPTLRPSEIADIMTRAAQFKKWLDDVTAYATDTALNKGITFPGWKLVEANIKRKYTDEEIVATKLEDSGFDLLDVCNVKLKSITDLTKLLGKEKFENLIGPYVEKPKGAPVLAPEKDKRPIYSAVDSAKDDFKEDILD